MNNVTPVKPVIDNSVFVFLPGGDIGKSCICTRFAITSSFMLGDHAVLTQDFAN